MFEAFFVAALLSISDPVGDATGNGSLQPPSAEVYRNLAPFDLRQVTVTDDPQLTLRIEMGSLSDPFDLPLGFSLPVIEVYLSGAKGGRNELLSGSGMRLPTGQGWEVAVRLTGEQATAYRVSSAPGGLDTAPVGVTVEGNELLVTTPFPRPDRPRVYGITGLYDLFGATPWRPLDRLESPWAFSSDSQLLPVIDVLARSQARQVQAIDSGILAPARNRAPIPGAVWLVLMAAGLLVALAGVGVRIWSRRATPAVGDGPEEVPSAASEFGPVFWHSDSTAEQAPSEAEPASRSFTWDSSALLTEPTEDELDEVLENEFGDVAGERTSAGYVETTDAWQRPVPLPFSPSNRDEVGQLAGEADPEVVRDDQSEAADGDVDGAEREADGSANERESKDSA